MTAEGAACCYRIDVSNMSISIHGVILTPTPRTERSVILLLECNKYLIDWHIFIDKYAALDRTYYVTVYASL
jgi:hypothetical protein